MPGQIGLSQSSFNAMFSHFTNIVNETWFNAAFKQGQLRDLLMEGLSIVSGENKSEPRRANINLYLLQGKHKSDHAALICQTGRRGRA